MKQTIRRNTPEDEAAIQRGIDGDPDAREMTDAEYASVRSASEVMPAATCNELTAARRRGPGAKPRKAQVRFRLDQDVVEGLRVTGPGWQSRANGALRKLVEG